MKETDSDTERAEALRAIQCAYLASQQVQDDRRALVRRARNEWGWRPARIARELGVAPGTVNAILTSGTD